MSRFASLPKVELHLHLEGAIPLDTLWSLMERHGGDPDTPDRQALATRFAYRDFAHFLATWDWKNGFLRTYQDFELVAEAVAADLARQQIVYAEAFFSPGDFAGLEPAELAMAIRRGLDRIDGTDVALIVDVVRDFGPERAMRVVEAILPVADQARVIGVGMGGTESAHPPEPFADVYAFARASGLHLTAHAGEDAGPESVWGAIRALGVERIGHGIRSVEDAALLDYLVEHQIPLEVCPTSNLRTGVVKSWDEHPVTRLIEAGAMVTINTDDPAMFGATLAGEYEALSDLGVPDDALIQLSTNAVDASWRGR